jgi:hypothetical protein
MRVFTSHASETAKTELNVLIGETVSVSAYQHAMTVLGQQLATAIGGKVELTNGAAVCIVCTVEDADFLARGMMEQLKQIGVSPERLKLVCFWNERVRHFNDDSHNVFDVAPVVKSYRENIDVESAVLVVVKSIISGACVVKTNLATLIDRMTPYKVIVAAPVMLKGAEIRLASEFPKSTADRFEYFTFAIDDEKRGVDNVFPGIGGSVYEHLGFGDNKTSYVPEIVRERRLLAA